MQIKLNLVTTFLIIGCQKAPVNNPYSTPTTYTWTKQELEQITSELNGNSQNISATLGKENVDSWNRCIIFEAQKSYPSKSVADKDTSGRMEMIGRTCSINVLRDPNSKKGQWSEKDREKMFSSFNQIRYSISEKVGEEQVDSWISCASNISENTFDSFADADYDPSAMIAIGAQCYADILRDPNSKIGQWTDTDKQLLLDTFGSQSEVLTQNVGEENVDTWLTCAVDQSEKTFRSFVDADYDYESKMTDVGTYCYKTILRDPNSQMGQWTDSDKKKFYDSIVSVESLQQTLGPDNVAPFAQCAVDKAEALYPSFIDADYDTGNSLVTIGEECTKTILNQRP